MAINERVKLIMEQKELTSGEFADKTGIQQSTLSHFINGRNKASLDVVMKIHEAFSDVSLKWLLYGKGEMHESFMHGNSYLSHQNGSESNEKNIDTQSRTSSGGATLDSLSAIAPILAQAKHEESQRAPQKPARKITEIRVFYDDNTYETFRSDK